MAFLPVTMYSRLNQLPKNTVCLKHAALAYTHTPSTAFRKEGCRKPVLGVWPTLSNYGTVRHSFLLLFYFIIFVSSCLSVPATAVQNTVLLLLAGSTRLTAVSVRSDSVKTDCFVCSRVFANILISVYIIIY